MKCFLSYNSSDKAVAEQVGVFLLQRNISTWLDKWDIVGGDSITDKIAEGIDRSDAFVILLRAPNKTTVG